MSKKDQKELLANLKEQMESAAKKLDFEAAANLRDSILELKAEMK
jgi:Helicase subunit of the DNA excision repair complex